MDSKTEVMRLRKKVGKWLKNWVVMPYQRESYEESIAELQAYVDGRKQAPSIVDLGTVYFRHLILYQNSALNEQGNASEDLVIALLYAESVTRIEEVRANLRKGGSLLKSEAALYFSLAVIAGWKESASRIGAVLVRGLDTDLLDLRHTDRHRAGEMYRHFWFVLHLYSKSGGLKFDTSLYSYPPDMSPYDVALAEWDTTDLAKVHEWVCAMADFHVQETRNTSHDNIDEFDAESVMLFPYEILCWLRLREWQGLSNPATFDHPLMQSPLARLPTPVPLPVPATPLLDQVIEKFKQEFPSSFS
jgi:hypothetical protein